MPKWTNDVPDQPRGHGLPIRRTPSTKPLEAIVSSDDLIGCYTHFWHGSTVPCNAPECDACKDGIPYRWHAYLSAVDAFTNLHFIFEITALGAEQFVAHRDIYNTLRGCYFRARRWNNRPNGRLLIQTKIADLKDRIIPNPPDLKKCMAILWNIPTDSVTTPDRHPENKIPRAQVNTQEDQ